jgi:hypothetical protein
LFGKGSWEITLTRTAGLRKAKAARSREARKSQELGKEPFALPCELPQQAMGDAVKVALPGLFKSLSLALLSLFLCSGNGDTADQTTHGSPDRVPQEEWGRAAEIGGGSEVLRSIQEILGECERLRGVTGRERRGGDGRLVVPSQRLMITAADLPPVRSSGPRLVEAKPGDPVLCLRSGRLRSLSDGHDG